MRYGTLSRQLATLAGPIFVETLLVMMLGAVDTFMLDENIRGVIFIRRWNSMKWAGKQFTLR